MIKATSWLPPNDNDTQHGCEWRDFANHLKCQLATVEAKLEVVMQAFAKRSGKMGKMPKIARPPRTPAEVADSHLHFVHADEPSFKQTTRTSKAFIWALLVRASRATPSVSRVVATFLSPCSAGRQAPFFGGDYRGYALVGGKGQT